MRAGECDRDARQLLGDFVSHIESETYDHPAQRISLPPRLAENAADFSAAEQEIVGPLQLKRPLDDALDGLSCGEPCPKAHDLHRPRYRWPMEHAKPETT